MERHVGVYGEEASRLTGLVWVGCRGAGWCVSVPHSDPAINEAADWVPRNILELVQ